MIIVVSAGKLHFMIIVVSAGKLRFMIIVVYNLAMERNHDQKVTSIKLPCFDSSEHHS